MDARWIMNLLQGEKLTPEEAREMLVKTCTAKRLLDELEVVQREDERKIVRQAKEETLRKLAQRQKPFRSFPAIETWKEQYDTELYRYKFLVLVGPSRMGKTQLARSLLDPSAPGELLEVNCASGEEPDLRRFQWSRHKLILFDEVQAKQVAAQRLLFQACTSDVTLACSATNCHSYTIYVHRVRMVLCTNSWEEDVRLMCPGDRDWLESNSVVVPITAPCWLD